MRDSRARSQMELNARQSKSFTKFPRKPFPNLLKQLDVRLQMSSNSKNYFGFLVAREGWAMGYLVGAWP